MEPLESPKVDERLGTPRDLNGDGLVDSVNHAGDYLLLPVSLTLRWKGKTGVRVLEIQTFLADR